MQPAPTLPTAPRSPAFRHELARAAARDGRALLPGDADPMTCMLARYLAREKLCSTAGERRALAQKHPDLAAALAIEREPDRGAGTWIDALVLAREDPFDIGRRSRLSSPVVAAYCDCFFSVGEWIDDQAFVFDQVVRAEMSRGRPAVALRNATIKFVAYVAGSDGLAELFSTGPSQPQELWRPLPYMVQRVGLARDLESLVAAALPGTPNPAPADAAQLEALVARVRTVVRPAVAKTKLQREGARMGTPRHTDESPFRQTGPGLTL